eukprot:6939080-Alexandrium_andersonii.AAC.1
MQQQRGAKGGKLTPALAASYRLAPDGVLERKVHLASAALRAPCIPDAPMDTVERLNWRKWFVETHHLVRRTGYWDNQATDVDR